MAEENLIIQQAKINTTESDMTEEVWALFSDNKVSCGSILSPDGRTICLALEFNDTPLDSLRVLVLDGLFIEWLETHRYTNGEDVLHYFPQLRIQDILDVMDIEVNATKKDPKTVLYLQSVEGEMTQAQLRGIARVITECFGGSLPARQQSVYSSVMYAEDEVDKRESDMSLIDRLNGVLLT